MKKAPQKSVKSAPKASASTAQSASKMDVNRILVGVRIEPRLVKVMKALAELHDCALGELIEKVFWNAMEGNSAFADKGRMSNEVRQQIISLKQVYGVNYDLEDLMKPRPRKSSKK